MKRNYGGILRGLSNIGASLLLTGAVYVLSAIRMLPEGTAPEEIRGMASVFFSASLTLIGGLLCFINILNWYFIEDKIRITMGQTRKKVFIDMQITKLVSAAGIFLIVLFAAGEGLKNDDFQWLYWSFGLLMLLQALGELIVQVTMRYRWIGVVLMTAASAVIGFVIAFGVMGFMKNNVFQFPVNVEMLLKTPAVNAVLFILLYLLLGFFSWKLWEKSETAL